MHDTCTVFCRHVVTRNDAECALSWIYPWEERFVLQANEVCTFVTRYDIRLQQVTVCIHIAQLFLIGIQTRLS